MQSEFTIAPRGYGRLVRPFVAPLVLFFLVLMLVGSAFGGMLVGVLVGLLGVAALAGLLALKFRAMHTGTTVAFSEHGVRLDDAKGFHVAIAWPDVTAVDRVDTRMASQRPIGIGVGVRVTPGAVASLGLIGWGHRDIPKRAPAWLRRQLAEQPKDVNGRPLVAIPLGAIDANWTAGAMGEWVRAYRPDLLVRSA